VTIKKVLERLQKANLKMSSPLSTFSGTKIIIALSSIDIL